MLGQILYILILGIIVMSIWTRISEIFDQIFHKHESLIHWWKQKNSILEVVDIFALYSPIVIILLSIFSEIFFQIGDIYYVVIAIIYLAANYSTQWYLNFDRPKYEVQFLIVSWISIFLIFYSFSLAESLLAILTFIFFLKKRRYLEKKIKLIYK